jgi:hypothetical protein
VALTRRGKFVEVYYDGVSQGIDARGNSGGPLSGGLGAIGCHLGFVKDEVRNFGRPGSRGRSTRCTCSPGPSRRTRSSGS